MDEDGAEHYNGQADVVAMEKRFDFLNILGHLRCSIVHVDAGADRARHTVDRLPYSRLFFVRHVPDAGRPGFIAWKSGASRRQLELKSFTVYFVPKGLRLEARIVAGTEIAVVHYLLEAFQGYDLFESATECAEIQHAERVCRFMYKSLSRPSTMSDYMDILAAVLEVSGQFFDAEGEDFRRIVALRQRYAPVVMLLRNARSAHLRVQDLADAMDMERSTFSKRFLQDIGLTPKDYLTQLVMRRAADLVSGTNRRLRDIAVELHFSDEYYFSRSFKKHFGCQPSVFRERHVAQDKAQSVH